MGYEDTSPTAKMQASYTDLILIVSLGCFLKCRTTQYLQNKWEFVSERALEVVYDHLHTLNDLTPKLRCQGQAGVDPNLIFGLQSKLFSEENPMLSDHHQEVETLTLYRGSASGMASHHTGHSGDCTCHQSPSQLVADGLRLGGLSEGVLTEALCQLPKETIWRVKGFVRLEPDGAVYILNWAFGALRAYISARQRSRQR